MKKYEQKAEKCVVSINFKPNKTFWIATNTNYREVPNTNFTKYVKIDLIQNFPNANNTNPNLTKYIKQPPNTGILNIFSVFANTKCHALVRCLPHTPIFRSSHDAFLADYKTIKHQRQSLLVLSVCI